MTAICKSGQTREMLHGHAAVRARKRNPNDWEMFAYPKLVFMEEATTPNIQRTLDLQKEKAEALETTPREIAIAFFRHVISEVIGEKTEAFKIHINISDRWPNRNVQDLMVSLQGLRANVDFEHVDECLSSIIGRIPNDASGVYVVIDCGHSGMVCSNPVVILFSLTQGRMQALPTSRPGQGTKSITGKTTMQAQGKSTWPWKMQFEK